MRLRVVVLLGISVVGLVVIRDDDVLEPLDRFEAMRPRDDHAHGPATDQRDGFAVEPVGEEGGKLAWRRLHRLRIADRRLETLLRVVVVKAPVVDAAHIAHRAAEPEHFAQRHTFPKTLAQRRGNIEALHGLEELH